MTISILLADSILAIRLSEHFGTGGGGRGLNHLAKP
jgi:hypothetical protein